MVITHTSFTPYHHIQTHIPPHPHACIPPFTGTWVGMNPKQCPLSHVPSRASGLLSLHPTLEARTALASSLSKGSLGSATPTSLHYKKCMSFIPPRGKIPHCFPLLDVTGALLVAGRGVSHCASWRLPVAQVMSVCILLITSIFFLPVFISIC